jgi:hypothetical protein
VVRLSSALACLLVGGVAFADGARIRWRGVAIEGRAPPSLAAATAAHVAVAVKQLGSALVTVPPASVDAAASCVFVGRLARCKVGIASPAGGKAERRAEIRYHDAEDLAESLALLVSDILAAEFPDVVGAKAQQPPPPQPPPPQPPPPQPPPPDEKARAAHEAEMQRQLALVEKMQREAEERARVAEERARRVVEAPKPAPRPPPEKRLAIEIGADGVFGLGSANPTLGGGAARLTWSRAFLRIGSSLSLTGIRQTLQGHDLSFFRALVAARAGFGVRGRSVDFDLTAGPALLVLVDDAHAEGRHAVASLAFVVGPRLALTLSGRLALLVGADLDVAVTDEKVLVGDLRLAQFSRAAVEVTLGLAWRTH